MDGLPDAASLAAAAPPQPQQKRDEWSEGGISRLLHAYEAKWLLRNRAKLKWSDWVDIANDVSAHCSATETGKPGGTAKTPNQCKNKVESMKKRYRAESAAAARAGTIPGGTGAAGGTSWRFFGRMDGLLKGPAAGCSGQLQTELTNSISMDLLAAPVAKAEPEVCAEADIAALRQPPLPDAGPAGALSDLLNADANGSAAEKVDQVMHRESSRAADSDAANVSSPRSKGEANGGAEEEDRAWEDVLPSRKRKGLSSELDVARSIELLITGAVYYLLSIERQITCWNQQCLNESNISCDLNFISCESTGSSKYLDWKSETKIFNNCDAKLDSLNFTYGIFSNALSKGAVSTSFREKYFYCLWWGLLQLSSSGNPLQTSAFIVENVFAIAIGAISLILFAQLIGKMQTYLQSVSKRLEEWRLRQRDMEEWMRHHQLPPYLQERVQRFVQVKWLATRGVEEESILQALPADIRRDVQRHLCLDLVRRVPFFAEMDDQLLDAICERLVSFLCPEGTYISREGDPVNEMLFIIRGKLESSTTNGGRSNFFNSILLKPGEELLTWALLPKTNVHFPLSTRTVRSLTEVEAFALRAEDLKFVANQFRRLHSKKLQHTFRFYSHHWRTWAACFIQAAWRQHQRRKLSESLSRWESYSWWSEEHPVADKPKQEGTSRTAAEGAVAQMHKFPSASRRFRADDSVIRRLQKPDEPDFSADHFD